MASTWPPKPVAGHPNASYQLRPAHRRSATSDSQNNVSRSRFESSPTPRSNTYQRQHWNPDADYKQYFHHRDNPSNAASVHPWLPGVPQWWSGQPITPWQAHMQGCYLPSWLPSSQHHSTYNPMTDINSRNLQILQNRHSQQQNWANHNFYQPHSSYQQAPFYSQGSANRGKSHNMSNRPQNAPRSKKNHRQQRNKAAPVSLSSSIANASQSYLGQQLEPVMLQTSKPEDPIQVSANDQLGTSLLSHQRKRSESFPPMLDALHPLEHPVNSVISTVDLGSGHMPSATVASSSEEEPVLATDPQPIVWTKQSRQDFDLELSRLGTKKHARRHSDSEAGLVHNDDDGQEEREYLIEKLCAKLKTMDKKDAEICSRWMNSVFFNKDCDQKTENKTNVDTGLARN